MANRTVLVTLQGNVAGYMASMRAASAATAQFAGTAAKSTAAAAAPMKQLGQEAKMLPMGLSATTTAIGALAIGMVASGKAAVDWETAWTGVTKTVDGSPEQMAALEAELRGLAKTLPSTHAEIAGVAEAAGQLGIERENVTAFTKTMIDLGETTNLQAGEAATSLARFMNIMGTSQADVSRLGSSVVELGNNFATTEAEIVDMGTRIASAGRQIGLTEGDVFGLATALSSVGIEAEAGGTAISRVMIDMAKSVDTGNEKLATFASVSGVSVAEFSRMFREDAGGAITAFIEGLGAVQASGQSVQPILETLGMTDVRVGNAMRSAASASDLFADAMRTGNDAYRENVALTDEAAKRYETMASRLEVAKNKARDAAITIGGPLAESFVSIIEPIAGAVDALVRFNDEIKSGLSESQSQLGELDGGEGWSFFYNIGDLLGDVGRSFAYWRIMLSDSKEAADEFWNSTNKVEGAVEGVGDVFGPTIAESEAFAKTAQNSAGSLDDLGQSAEEAADEIEAVANSIRDLGSTTLDARAAQRDLAAAVDDASASLKDNGKTLNRNTEAGRSNAAALDNIAASGKQASAAVLEQTGSQQRANGVMRQARTDFINAAVSMGMSRDRAKELATRLGLIPRKVETQVSLPGLGSSLTELARYKGSLDGIPRNVTTVITTLRKQAKIGGSLSGDQSGLKDGGWIGAPKFAPGGWVSGAGTTKSDSVPAWLSRGEFVVNAASAASNAALLEAINSGRNVGAGVNVNVSGTSEQVVNQIAQRLRYEQALAGAVV